MATAKKKAAPKKAAPKKAAPKKAKKSCVQRIIGAGRKLLGADTPPLPRFSWDPKSLKDVEVAEEVFKLHQAKRRSAFFLTPKGSQGKPMAKFDPTAGAMVFGKAKSRYDRISDGD